MPGIPLRLAGAVGLLLAWAILSAATSLLATYVPRANEIAIDLPFVPGSGQPLVRDGYVRGSRSGFAVVAVRRITPGYLRAMGIPVLRGGDIVENDGEVLLVSREAGRLVWGGDDPIGRGAGSSCSRRTVQREVGRNRRRRQAARPGEPSTPTVYYYSRDRDWSLATLVVRTSAPPATFVRPVVAAIHAIDPEQQVVNMPTMEEVLDSTVTPQRYSALVLGRLAIHTSQRPVRVRFGPSPSAQPRPSAARRDTNRRRTRSDSCLCQ